MSADPIDRRGLERKTKGELITIVETLGGKPGSNARKPELVDQILQLAGVADPTPDTPSDPAPGPGGDGGTTDAGEGRTKADDGPDANGTSSDVGAGEGTTGDVGDSAPEPSSKKNPAPSDDDSSGPGAGRTPAARADRGHDTDNAAGADSSSANAAGGNGGGSTGSGDNGDSSDTNGDGESKNRRRRRGRNRDRADDVDSGQWDGEPIAVAGTLDLRDEGYGFLRINGVLPSREDVYVSVKQTRQFGLRRGDWITGSSRPANRSEKNPALLRIDTVNGGEPERARDRAAFEDLTPLFPNEHLKLEREDHPYDLTSRIIDLLAPIGKGQRGLIVAPPKSGKTTVMKTIAQAIEDNHPEVQLIVILVDERPEEVTDMRRSISGEVVASTFDRPPEEHIGLVDLVVERAKRMVEDGQDVVILMDGITRLSRAYNLAAPAGGRIMSGGLDAGALYPPKRIFGAARNIEDGGSLTILATALVDTNSKMDEIIFEEFKGTGNMELRLDRDAAERRIFPAIDVAGSSTRHEELLIEPQRLQQIWKLRRLLVALSSDGEEGAALDLVLDRMRKFPTNDSFLDEIGKSPAIR